MVQQREYGFTRRMLLPLLLASVLILNNLLMATGPGVPFVHTSPGTGNYSSPGGGGGNRFPLLPATAISSTSKSKTTTTSKASSSAAASSSSSSSKKSSSSSKGIKGIDVSRYQGNINWSKVSKAGIEFTFVRSSYGTKIDPYFYQNVEGANKYGIAVGAYHFATFNSTSAAKKEARYFVSLLDKADVNLPVVLDLEHNYGLSRSKLTTAALAFMEIVEDAGYNIMLYSYENFFNTYINLSAFNNYDLWVANYTGKAVKLNHVVWQHSSTGKVSGISGPVDLNISYLSVSEMKKRAKREDTSTNIVNLETETSNSTTPRSYSTGTAVSTGTTTASSGSSTTVSSTRPSTSSNSTSTSSSGGSSSSSSTSSSSGSSVKNTSSGATQNDDGSIRINKASAQRIQDILNTRYGATFSNDSLVLEEFRTAIVMGIQTELNKQYRAGLKVTGKMDDATIKAMSKVSLSLNEENNIAYLIQCALYFKGGFSGTITGTYDANTRDLVKAYQIANKLSNKTGAPESETLVSLFTPQS